MNKNISTINKIIKIIFPTIGMLFLIELFFMLNAELRIIFQKINNYPILYGIALPFAIFIVANLSCICMEYFIPGTKNKRKYMQGLKYWLLFFCVNIFLANLFIYLISKFNFDPILKINMQGSWGGWFEVVVGIFGFLLIFDFFYYTFHRMQHTIPFLWKMHKVHHSIENLNCINCYHHIFEEVLRFPVITIPMAFLLKFDTGQIIFATSFVGTWSYYIHSDMKLHISQAIPFFNDNAHHRIHHGYEKKYYNKNYSAFFPIWDKIFGTYKKPNYNEAFPRVGLAEIQQPDSMLNYLIIPFKK